MSACIICLCYYTKNLLLARQNTTQFVLISSRAIYAKMLIKVSQQSAPTQHYLGLPCYGCDLHDLLGFQGVYDWALADVRVANKSHTADNEAPGLVRALHEHLPTQGWPAPRLSAWFWEQRAQRTGTSQERRGARGRGRNGEVISSPPAPLPPRRLITRPSFSARAVFSKTKRRAWGEPVSRPTQESAAYGTLFVSCQCGAEGRKAWKNQSVMYASAVALAFEEMRKRREIFVRKFWNAYQQNRETNGAFQKHLYHHQTIQRKYRNAVRKRCALSFHNTRVPSVIVCLMCGLRRCWDWIPLFCVRCRLPRFCAQIYFYAYYTQKFALTRSLYTWCRQIEWFCAGRKKYKRKKTLTVGGDSDSPSRDGKTRDIESSRKFWNMNTLRFLTYLTSIIWKRQV